MINVLISGANGRMGKKVYEACLRDSEILAVCGVDLNDGNNGELKIYSSFVIGKPCNNLSFKDISMKSPYPSLL